MDWGFVGETFREPDAMVGSISDNMIRWKFAFPCPANSNKRLLIRLKSETIKSIRPSPVKSARAISPNWKSKRNSSNDSRESVRSNSSSLTANVPSMPPCRPPWFRRTCKRPDKYSTMSMSPSSSRSPNSRFWFTVPSKVNDWPSPSLAKICVPATTSGNPSPLKSKTSVS